MAIFGSINSFAKMVAYNSYLGANNLKLQYVLYPKLHGTNASIKISPDGSVEYRSKNRVLSYNSDNAGFVAGVSGEEAIITSQFIDFTEEVILWGEWIGQGIHKSDDAACKVPNKTFVVFAVQHGNYMDTDLEKYTNQARVCGFTLVEPAAFMNIDFTYGTDLTTQVELINDEVEFIGAEDWFIKDKFNVKGEGEGVVGVPFGVVGEEDYFRFAFKGKTEAHRVKKTKSAATVNEPMPHEVLQFVDMMVTEARIKQAIAETDSILDMSDTPKILKWVANDIIKEGQEELLSMGIEWKKVAKAVNHKTVNIWKGLVNDTQTDPYDSYVANAAASLD